MSTKAQIKVIKRGAQTEKPIAQNNAAPPAKNAKETAREMVSTVSGWVQEFQQKRRAETGEAIRKLFVESTGCANC